MPIADQHAEGTFVVPPELNGFRSTDVLQRLMPEVHRRALRDIVRDGKVLLNGSELKPWKKLRTGDLLTFVDELDPASLPRFRKARIAAPAVLHEDAACIAVDKPAGLATVPERHGDGSVHGCLVEWFGDLDLRVVHRLDKETSGVLLLAKGKAAAQAFDGLFRERQVAKAYLALVRGSPREDEFACEIPIGKTIRGGKVKLGDAKGAREARTEFRVLQRFRGFALIEARPLTGRMHQIRVHLAANRLPLAVDHLYGGGRRGVLLSEFKTGYRARRGKDERPLIDRLTLHAQRIAFASPDGGARVELEAEVPKDLRVTIAKLERFAGADA